MNITGLTGSLYPPGAKFRDRVKGVRARKLAVRRLISPALPRRPVPGRHERLSSKTVGRTPQPPSTLGQRPPLNPGYVYGPGGRPVAAPGGVAAKPVAKPAPDPRDALYYSRLGQLQSSDTQQLAQGQQQLSALADSQAEALRRLADQRDTTLTNTQRQANREGLYYSGQLGLRQGNVEKAYGQQQTDLNARTGSQKQSLLDRMAAIRSSEPYAQQTLYGEAVQRYLANQAAAPPPVVNSRAGEPHKTVVVHGRTYHVYPDGRRVLVR